jgi:hypothetical protein
LDGTDGIDQTDQIDPVVVQFLISKSAMFCLETMTSLSFVLTVALMNPRPW